MRSASSPDTGRPVRIMSRAWLWPIRRGRRIVPPSMSGTPQRRQNTPKTASVAATRRSHQMASSSPPATAYPSTAAMTGLERSMREGPIGPSPSSTTRLPRPSATPFRSAPAQNVPPAPARAATAASVSAPKRRNAAASAAAVGPSTALRTAGRSMVMTYAGPSRSSRTVGALMALRSNGGWARSMRAVAETEPLYRMTVEAGRRDQVLVAPGPTGEADLGLLAAGLHAKPRQRGRSAGASAGIQENRRQAIARLLIEVLEHDRVIDDGCDPRHGCGESASEPVGRARTLHPGGNTTGERARRLEERQACALV